MASSQLSAAVSQLPSVNVVRSMAMIVLLHLLALCQTVLGIPCQQLLPGQFYCPSLELQNQQQLPPDVVCHANNSALVQCFPVEDLECDGLTVNGSFYHQTSCRYSSGKDWRIALILSIFFGWLGFDRFYLGYFGLGLVKLCTFGFFLIFHLIDVILIALQVVGPADGSGYALDYYGPHSVHITYDNGTRLLEPHRFALPDLQQQQHRHVAHQML